MHDVVIRGGTVIDGTGGAARSGDVAIAGGRIVEVGRVTGRARREVAADGAVVAPGFVDVHTHYDGQATWDQDLQPSCWHGVTTVVMGNCGVGFAPVEASRRTWLIELMEGVEDIPGTALHEGIAWGWESFPEYLDCLARLPHVLDVAAYVPHSPIRGYVMGDRGADHLAVPTEREVAAMAALVAQGVDAGAIGFSTSRTVVHKSADGRSIPTLSASSDELLGITAALRTKHGVLQVISDFSDVGAELELLWRMAETSGMTLFTTTQQRHDQGADDYRELLAGMERAEDAGVRIRGQVAPRPTGVLLSIEGSWNPLDHASSYRRIQHLPLTEQVAALAAPELRRQVVDELEHGLGDHYLTRARYAFVMEDPPRYDYRPEDSVASTAERRGVSSIEVIVDALLQDGGTGMVYIPATNFVDGNLDAVREMLVHPLTIPGLGDGGAHCSIIADAGFPTFLLTYWGRDAPADQRLPLPWLVQRQTATVASMVGMHDRGVIARGYKADVNVIDMERLSLQRPRMVRDLPLGGRRLDQRAAGYVATFVAGEVIQEHGELTGATPGSLVRGGRAR